MACFLVSTVAALGVATARHIVKHNENKNTELVVENKEYKFGSEMKWSKKLAYLELTLLGGSLLLAGEHILHGEVTPYPPFLTAAGESADAAREMLTEMGTVGVTMLVALVAAWGVGILLYDFIKYRRHKKKLVEAK